MLLALSVLSGSVESRLLAWYRWHNDRQMIGESAVVAGLPELWESALFVPEKTGLCFKELEKKEVGYRGTKMQQKHFQDKIRENRAGDEAVQSQQHFRRNSSSSLLVGRNMLNVSVCLGILFPGGLI